METLPGYSPQTDVEFDRKDENPIVIKIEALKILAALLLKHLESLEKTPMPFTGKSGVKTSLTDEVQIYEAELIRDALIYAKGSQRKAARMLGTKASTLNSKIKRYGIDPFDLVGSQ